MDYKISIVRYLYYLSFLGLLILYLFPGSLIGYFLFGDFGKQPDFIPNPLGTSINHALAFFYLTIIGLVAHINEGSFKRTVFFLLALSLLLELSHFLVPNRFFQFTDLIGNLIGTVLAIVVIFSYKKFKNGKI
tara:strand:- start:9 stop:407 length:399 start_codon:yes stop_codon:yes gene_type:complete